MLNIIFRALDLVTLGHKTVSSTFEQVFPFSAPLDISIYGGRIEKGSWEGRSEIGVADASKNGYD